MTSTYNVYMATKRENVLSVRVSVDALRSVDSIAEEMDWPRSMVIRKLLTLGMQAWAAGKR